MANEISIEVFSGNDLTLHCTCFIEDSSDPLDISGATLLDFGVAKTQGKSPYFTRSLGAGAVVITDGPAGEFDVIIPRALLEPLKGELYCECLLVKDGKASTIMYGEFVIPDNSLKADA